MEIFLCCSVHFLASCESQKTHGGQKKGFFSVLLPGREAEPTPTVFWLWSVLQSRYSCIKKSASLSVWRGPHGCVRECVFREVDQWVPWDQERDRRLSGEEGRVCDRLQWLVEHSGQNLSDSAEAVNHFGLQLCNLSPTSRHITASELLAVWRLRRAWLSLLVHFWTSVLRIIELFEFMNSEMLAYMHVCMTGHFTWGRNSLQ